MILYTKIVVRPERTGSNQNERERSTIWLGFKLRPKGAKPFSFRGWGRGQYFQSGRFLSTQWIFDFWRGTKKVFLPAGQPCGYFYHGYFYQRPLEASTARDMIVCRDRFWTIPWRIESPFLFSSKKWICHFRSFLTIFGLFDHFSHFVIFGHFWSFWGHFRPKVQGWLIWDAFSECKKFTIFLEHLMRKPPVSIFWNIRQF